MMDTLISLWIRELRRFNPQMHLMGPAMLASIEEELQILLPLLGNIHEEELADLGSGSGLPAIPYKILHPQAKVWLIERSVKKCVFLRHVVELLGLTGVEVLPRDPLHTKTGRFNAVLARSFSPLSTLEKVCRRILHEGGRLYYLSTGGPPVLGEGFRLDEIFPEESKGYRVHLAVFTRLP